MNNFEAGLNWYVVRTKPRKEDCARTYLEKEGLNTFLPLMEAPSSYTANKAKTVKPLFPSYLFAQFDLSCNYPLVRWAKGVNTILGFGKYPTPVSDEVIAIIKSRTDEKNVVKKARHFKQHDRVRVTSGPLKDLLGMFERWISDEGRIRVLLNLVGYQPKVDLHYSQVEKIS